MHVIAISNQKGGCGKTTSAINIAASLASLHKRTLLIDLDPQAHATFGLGIRTERLESSIYNVLTEQGEKRDFIENVILPIDEYLDLAPSHVLLSTIEQEFTNKDESVSRLHDIFSNISFPYQYVVIDCPPSLGFLTFNALRASKTVIVPIELSSFSLMGVSKLLSMIELIRVKLQHTPTVYALPTMVDIRTNFAKGMIEEIKQSFGEHVFKNSVRQTVSVKESQAQGKSLMQHNPKSKGAMDYYLLTQELLSKINDKADQPVSQNGRLSQPSDFLRDFMLNAQGAREVHIVGDFNNWNVSDQSLLWRKDEGLWHKRLFLGPGRYRYKFIIDGQWVTDPSNERLESNPYGGVDSVMEIGQDLPENK